MNCSKCGRTYDELPWFHVAHRNMVWNFCSRRCLVEGMAPELDKAISVKQWIPTPDEEARMSE